MKKKFININNLKKTALSAGCVLAAAGCISLGAKIFKQDKVIYQAPENQIEITVDNQVESESTSNSLEDDFVKSYFMIEDYQNYIAKSNHNKNQIKADMQSALTELNKNTQKTLDLADMQSALTELNKNTQKLLNLLEQMMIDDITEATECGLTKKRINELQANNLKDITDYEKTILEKIAVKLEVCQFLEARNAVRSGLGKNAISDFNFNNHYLDVIKNNDLRENSKQLMNVAKQNILGLSVNNKTTTEQTTEQAGNYYNVYFDDLHLYARMFILADYIPESLKENGIDNCLALEILTQHQLNKYCNDLEKSGYDVNEIVSLAQNQIEKVIVEQPVNKKLAKKKSKFINQSIKVISQIGNTQEMTK